MKKIPFMHLAMAVLATLVATGCPTPQQSPSLSRAEREARLGEAAELIDIATALLPRGSLAEMVLPTAVVGYDDISLVWESSSPWLVVSDRQAIASEPPNSTVVSLVVTLSDRVVTLERTFLIKIYAQNDSNIPSSAWVEAAKAELSMEYDSTLVFQRVSLPLEIDALGVDISWESGDESLARISADGSECTIVGGLVEARVSVTARITRGSASSTKMFSLLVPRITELQRISTHSNNGVPYTDTETITVGENAFTRTRESTAEGSMPQIEKWSFSQGPESGTLRMTINEVTLFGTVIRSNAGVVTLFMKPFLSLINYMELFEGSKTKDNFLAIIFYTQNINNPHLEWQTASTVQKNNLVDKLIENDVLPVSSVQQFNSLSDEALADPMEEHVQYWKNTLCRIFNLESDTSYATIRTRLGFMVEAQYGFLFKTNTLYAYRIHNPSVSGSNTHYPQGLWMDTEPLFESGRPWYQQAVSYKYYSEELGASGDLYQPGSNRRGQFSYSLQSGNGWTHTSVYGTYNSSYTRFVDLSNREWTVTASSDARSVTFTCDGMQFTFVAPAL